MRRSARSSSAVVPFEAQFGTRPRSHSNDNLVRPRSANSLPSGRRPVSREGTFHTLGDLTRVGEHISELTELRRQVREQKSELSKLRRARGGSLSKKTSIPEETDDGTPTAVSKAPAQETQPDVAPRIELLQQLNAKMSTMRELLEQAEQQRREDKARIEQLEDRIRELESGSL